jgi:hypothetical protein
MSGCEVTRAKALAALHDSTANVAVATTFVATYRGNMKTCHYFKKGIWAAADKQ